MTFQQYSWGNFSLFVLPTKIIQSHTQNQTHNLFRLWLAESENVQHFNCRSVTRTAAKKLGVQLTPLMLLTSKAQYCILKWKSVLKKNVNVSFSVYQDRTLCWEFLKLSYRISCYPSFWLHYGNWHALTMHQRLQPCSTALLPMLVIPISPKPNQVQHNPANQLAPRSFCPGCIAGGFLVLYIYLNRVVVAEATFWRPWTAAHL